MPDQTTPQHPIAMTELPVIETLRTTLVVLQPGNAHLLQAFHLENREHLRPWEPQKADDYYSDAAFQKLGEQSRADFLAGQSVKLMAVHKTTQKMVAGCNFTNIIRGPLQACHLGYSVAQEWEGQGVMREVAGAGIAHLFGRAPGQPGLHRIMANHLPDHHRSAKLLAALGFEREGYARAYLKIDGRWQDMVLNALVNPSDAS